MGERKYYLDWLRVIAFGLLILFHVGMLYVTWDFNLKSDRIFPGLEWAMSAVSPWRLVLLFFISGVASRFLLAKLGAGRFAADRVRRLLPVLLLGMFVINPVQVYVELVSEGYVHGGYLDFWRGSYMRGDEYPGRSLPTWDHLWFLLYLLFYALILATVFAVRGKREHREIGLAWLIIVPGLWLCASNVLVSEVKPATQAFFDDWANHLRWFGIYAAGVVCGGQAGLWEALRVRRRTLAVASVVGFAAVVANGVYYASGRADPVWDGVIYGVVTGVYGWSMVLTLAGHAAEYLNRSSNALRYLTDAVLPVYVLHQPIMLVFAFVLFPLHLPVPLEAILLIVVTGAGSFLAYELFARRTRVMRFLFGLRPIRASEAVTVREAEPAALA